MIIRKEFLMLLNLIMLLKRRNVSLLRNIVHLNFGELLIGFSAKVNLLYVLHVMALRCFHLHLIKQNCLLKTFQKTLILVLRYLFT